MAKDFKSPMGIYLSELESTHIDPVAQFKISVSEKVSIHSKLLTISDQIYGIPRLRQSKFESVRILPYLR